MTPSLGLDPVQASSDWNDEAFSWQKNKKKKKKIIFGEFVPKISWPPVSKKMSQKIQNVVQMTKHFFPPKIGAKKQSDYCWKKIVACTFNYNDRQICWGDVIKRKKRDTH